MRVGWKEVWSVRRKRACRKAVRSRRSNLMLDVLDKELEKRGHRSVRFADDCNIYVRSQRAGERVLAGMEVPRKAPQAQDQQSKERGRQAERSQIPGLQLHWLAAQTAGSPHGPWRLANSPALTIAVPTAFFASLGLASVAEKRHA